MKRFSWCWMVLIGMVLTVNSFAQTAAQYLAAGNQSYALKDYAKGAQYYKAAAQMDPNSAAAYQGLGNCEYMLGNASEALAAYEKVMSLNPGNTQLAPYIQSLRAKVAQSTALGGNSTDNSGTDTAAPNSGESEASPVDNAVKKKKWDLNFKFGTVVAGSESDSSGFGLGLGPAFGGGFEGYFLIGGHFGIGLIAQYYSGYAISYPGFNFNTSSFDFMAGLKYVFGNGSFKPYVLGSAGYSLLSSGISVNGGGGGSYPTVSTSGPVAQFGGGVAFSFGSAKKLGIFLQTKYNLIFVTSQYSTSTTTFSGVPIEIGLNLSL